MTIASNALMRFVSPALAVAPRFAAIGLVALLAACAGRTDGPMTQGGQSSAMADDANDPLETPNRFIFAFNQAVDAVLLRPLAVTYRDWVPGKVQDGVRNMLDNAAEPLNAIHNVLQGDFNRAGTAVQRFAFNTVGGVLGFFDVSGLPPVDEDAGQTFATWGAGEGPYMVLPVIGPSNLRDTVGLAVDSYIDPVNAYTRNQDDLDWIPVTRAVARGIDTRSRLLTTLDDLEKSSLDFYAAVRSLYRQRRASQIANGTVPPPPRLAQTAEDGMSRTPVRAQ